jgi:hypothetical protein
MRLLSMFNDAKIAKQPSMLSFLAKIWGSYLMTLQLPMLTAKQQEDGG